MVDLCQYEGVLTKTFRRPLCSERTLLASAWMRKFLRSADDPAIGTSGDAVGDALLG
jgi:hypothetical protein